MAARGLALILVVIGLTGCISNAPATRTAYTGPTDPMAKVVEDVNANNSRVPTLWAKGYYEANIVDHGKKYFVNGDVNLLYRQPSDLRLVAKKDVAGAVFEIGSNAEQYWLIVKADVDTMWHGRHGGEQANESQRMPIQPELMLEVLGVATIDTNFKQPPVPVMRFNDYADAYMFVWNAPAPDRWVATKEVWYDRASKLPVKVILFDANGRVVVGANLSKHKPAGADDASAAPKVATRYDLTFPDSGSSMTFELNELLPRRGNVPNDKSFLFPSEPGVNRIIDVDAPEPAAPRHAPER